MEVDISDDGVEALVEEHSEELTTEELHELEKGEHQTKLDTLSSDSNLHQSKKSL